MYLQFVCYKLVALGVMVRRLVDKVLDRLNNEPIITLATMITFVRLMLVPCIIASMVLHYWGTAVLLFFLATITDAADGAVARWRNEQTFFGAALDALTDKMLTVSCFVTLALIHTDLFSVPSWFVGVVLLKELFLVLGALYVYSCTTGMQIVPTRLGKLSMMMQTIFILWVLLCYFLRWVPVTSYYVMLGLVLFFLIASFLQYVQIGTRYIFDQ